MEKPVLNIIKCSRCKRKRQITDFKMKVDGTLYKLCTPCREIPVTQPKPEPILEPKPEVVVESVKAEPPVEVEKPILHPVTVVKEPVVVPKEPVPVEKKVETVEKKADKKAIFQLNRQKSKLDIDDRILTGVAGVMLGLAL